MTVNVRSPMEIVPARPRIESGKAETEYVTVPLPLPLAPAITVMKLSLETAVQAQPAGAVTLTVLPVAPPMAAVAEVGVSVTPQVYVKALASEPVPALVVTDTVFAPSEPAGVTAVIEVGDTRLTDVAAVPPTVTLGVP